MRYVRYILSTFMAPDFNIKCNKCTKCCEMKKNLNYKVYYPNLDNKFIIKFTCFVLFYSLVQ